MRKVVLAFMLILACFCLIGCSDVVNVPVQKPEQPEIIEKQVTIDAVETKGTVGEPSKSDSGVIVLTCEDSEGGIYTFKQQEVRAVSNSSTWEYSKNGKVLFAGTFVGNIDVTIEVSISSLSLTVTQAADETGKLIETKEDKTFEFTVEPEGTFVATIPSVEIIVQVVVEPSTPENPETTEKTRALLDAAVDLLMEGDVDGGIAKIKTAYKGQKNDETKMYYALAELASISVDESVATLLEENFGIVNYPATMNALLNGEWLKEYEKEEPYQLIDIEESSKGSLVRVSGDEVDDWGEYEDSIDIVAKQYDEDTWCESYNELINVTLDENGPYLVYMNGLNYEEIESSNVTRYNWIYREAWVYVTEGSIFAPEFAPVEGLDSVTTSSQLSLQIMANLLDCNPDGLNSGIDNVLAVFGDKFETAKSLAASMSNASVEVPADLFDALELEDVLGKSTLKVGKAELNLLIASMEILQGTFQWISSYDWYINIKDFEYTFVDDDLYFPMEEPLTLFRNVIDERTLTVRNAKAMTDSKESFIDAIDMVIDSYDYIIGNTSEYPQAARDQIEEYGEIIKEALDGVKTAIETEKVFYVPQEDPFETGTWNCSEESAMFGIDFGKFFTPGYFSDLIEKEADGSMKLSLHIRWYNVDSYEYTSKLFEISDIDSLEELETFAKEKFEELGIGEDKTEEDVWYHVVNKLNYQKLSDMLPKIELLEEDCYMFLFGKTISEIGSKE